MKYDDSIRKRLSEGMIDTSKVLDRMGGMIAEIVSWTKCQPEVRCEDRFSTPCFNTPSFSLYAAVNCINLKAEWSGHSL